MKRLFVLTALALACAESHDIGDVINLPDIGPRMSVWVPDSSATILSTSNSGINYPVQIIVSDTAAWRAVWNQAASWVPKPAVPTVNFDVDVVAVAALGGRGTGGYSIKLDSVALHDSGSVAFVTRTSPAPSCNVTGAITTPIHIVRLPAPPRPLFFMGFDRVLRC